MMNTFIAVIFTLFTVSSTVEGKAYKNLRKFYGEEVLLSRIQRDIPGGTLYTVDGKQDKVFIGSAESRFEQFEYMVILREGVIQQVKVLVYRENYGGEVCGKRYLERNYRGRGSPKPFVDAISGATISVNALNWSINRLLSNI